MLIVFCYIILVKYFLIIFNSKRIINNDSYSSIQISFKNGNKKTFVIKEYVKFVKKIKVKFQKAIKIISGIKKKCLFNSCTYYAHILCAYLAGIEFTFKEIPQKTTGFDE